MPIRARARTCPNSRAFIALPYASSNRDRVYVDPRAADIDARGRAIRSRPSDPRARRFPTQTRTTTGPPLVARQTRRRHARGQRLHERRRVRMRAAMHAAGSGPAAAPARSRPDGHRSHANDRTGLPTTGHVVDKSGNPVARACVSPAGGGAVQVLQRRQRAVRHTARPRSEAGSADRHDRCHAVRSVSTGDLPRWDGQALLPAPPAEVTVVAHRSGGVRGRLVTPSGTPLAHVCVSGDTVDLETSSGPFRPTTGDDGSFRADGLGTGTFYVEPGGFYCQTADYYSAATDWPTVRVDEGAFTELTLVATTFWDCPEAGDGACVRHDL